MNNNGRWFVIGDIHGHSTALLECLKAVEFDYQNDNIISLGDLVDRGPNCYEVAEIFLRIKNKILIQGNHDIWFKYFLTGHTNLHTMRAWLSNGGHATLDSYEKNGMDEHVRFDNKEAHVNLYLSQVPYFIKDNICFVHGGFNNKRLISKQDPESLAWDRDLVYKMMGCKENEKLETVDNFDKIFIGHTPTLCWSEAECGYESNETAIQRKINKVFHYPMTKPIYKGNVFNLDTGCGKGGKLTIMNLETEEYYQTKDKY